MFLSGFWRFFLEGSRGGTPPPTPPPVLTARVRLLRPRYYNGSGVETAYRWRLERTLFRAGSGREALPSWNLGRLPRGFRILGAPATTRWALGVSAPVPVLRLAVGPRWSLGSRRYTPGSGRNRVVGWLLGSPAAPQPLRLPSSAPRVWLGHTRFTPGNGRPSVHWWVGMELRSVVFAAPQARGGWGLGRQPPGLATVPPTTSGGWGLGGAQSPNTAPSVRTLPRWRLGR